MADEKTILRELSIIVGIGLAQAGNKINKLKPVLFLNMVEGFCENIQEYNVELNKLKSIRSFNDSQIAIIKNGFILGNCIYKELKPEGKICWTGKHVGSKYPYDITINDTGFSLKEDSYILKNPAFSDYLNALVQPKKPFKNIHVFRRFAPNEFNKWFNYAYSKLIEKARNLRNNSVIFSYKGKYFIKLIEDEIIFEKIKNKKVCIPISLQISEDKFNRDISNDIIEHTFSKWIKENLEKKDNEYLLLKKICSEAAGRNLKKFLESSRNYNIDKLLEILQIYEDVYYFGKCLNGIPNLFKVPSKDKCDIISLTIDFNVPKSQLNVLFTFEVVVRLNGHGKNNTIEMHAECRYSHGQFNGIPEAKLYCKDRLDKLYHKVI
jgi:hypothetical protein